MEIQVDPALLVVNLENCIDSQATRQIVKGECMYTVAVANDDATMVQIPVSLHCTGNVQQAFGAIAELQQQSVSTSNHQTFSQVQPQQYTQIQMTEEIPCLVTTSDQNVIKDTSKESTEVFVTEQHSALDVHSFFYNDIFNYLTSNTVPEGATMSQKILLKKRAKCYCVKDGILYYGHTKPKKVITDKEEQLTILQDTHIEPGTGIHLGVKKMYSAVNNLCFWRGQYMDVANFVRQCNKCTESGETRLSILHQESSQLSNTEDKGGTGQTAQKSSKVWEKVEVTVHGPYAKTVNHNEYIVTMADPVSHWILAQPVSDGNLPSQLVAFIYDAFCLFGFAKCHIGKLSDELMEAIKTTYQQQEAEMQEALTMLGYPCGAVTKNSFFVLNELEEQCGWVHSLLDSFVHNNLTTWDMGLNKFLFELNTSTKNVAESAFFNMFGRKPISYSQENKENSDINVQSKDQEVTARRRRLQSSILQCRHCEEVFTSKISFRIHQRKHTEEARQRGMLEGEEPIRLIVDRERRLLKRPMLKRRQRFMKQHGNSEGEDRLNPLVSQRSAETATQMDVTEGRRAELRANTVAAVRRLLASTKDSRKRRGKYMKFSTEIQEEMARYAIDHGSLKTVRHFSARLGVVVSESTIRNIVKWYQCYTPEIKEEIGRFAAAYGVDAAVAHFSERLGREVRHGLIRKFRKMYLLRYPELKRQCMKKKITKIRTTGSNSDISSRQKKNTYSTELKEEIGRYAYEHNVPAAVSHFSQKLNFSLKEHVVRRCRKTFIAKHRAIQEQQMFNEHREQQQQQQQQQHHQHHQQQQQQQHQQQQQQQHQQSGSLLQQQLQHNNGPSIQESLAPSHSQTIDILQTSLNLLNNPQLNSSATVVYNHPYQPTTLPHIQPSNHLIPMNHQQNPSLTFQSVNQCNSNNNIPTSMPVSYQHQQVPISASVIMNQNVTTVQAFQQAQVYPPFNQQSESIQTVPVTVPNTVSLPLAITQTPSQQTPLPQHVQHSTLSTIAVAVAPAHSEQHYQQPSDPAAVVVSQDLPQHPIIVSHPQGATTIVQHFMASQSSQTHLQHQLINGTHPSTESVQPFAQILDHHDLNTDAFSQTLNGNIGTMSFEASAPTLLEDRGEAFSTSTNMEPEEAVRGKVMPCCNLHHLPRNDPDDVTITLVTKQEALEGCNGIPEPQQQQQSTVAQVEIPQQEQNNIIHVVVDYPLEEDMNDLTKEKTELANTSNTSNKSSTKKGGRKKNGQGGSSKGNAKRSTGQKRGNYTTYSPEIRAEMGRYAAEHGSQRACLYFRAKLGHEVAESTVRGLRDKYLMKREHCSAGSESNKDKEVTSLGYAPRGRPMRLGKYDEVVQECIHDLVRSGEKISSFLAITTAKQVLMQYEPHLLEENGGNIKLNITWAKSFLKRIGIKNYS